MEKPINLKSHDVCAILDGRKTQLRRIAKEFDGKNVDAIIKRWPNQEGCPYGQPGDRLWVREAFKISPAWGHAVYRADVPATKAEEVDHAFGPWKMWTLPARSADTNSKWTAFTNHRDLTDEHKCGSSNSNGFPNNNLTQQPNGTKVPDERNHRMRRHNPRPWNRHRPHNVGIERISGDLTKNTK